jgi:hypothetical protein
MRLHEIGSLGLPIDKPKTWPVSPANPSQIIADLRTVQNVSGLGVAFVLQG